MAPATGKPAQGPRRGAGGIRKRGRVDRDGDLIMGAAPKVAARPSGPRSTASAPNSATLMDLKVSGWTDESDVPNLIKFLEKHATKRKPSARHGGPNSNAMIRKHRIEGTDLIIRVRPEDLVPFGKVNGFSFTPQDGCSVKLLISSARHAGPAVVDEEEKQRMEKARSNRLQQAINQSRYGGSDTAQPSNESTSKTADESSGVKTSKESSGVTPMPAPKGTWNDTDGIAERFLVDFLLGYDTNRDETAQKYYDATSTFSLSVNTGAQGGSNHERTPWDAYLALSRNLQKINNNQTRFNRKFVGLDQIRKAFNTLPPTRHPSLQTDIAKYNLSCQIQTAIPEPNGEYPQGVSGLMITVHGQFEEHRTAKGANEIVRRSFDRTIILGPGAATGVRVVSDLLCLRAYGGVPAWSPVGADFGTNGNVNGQAPRYTDAQQEMVMYVSKETNMTIHYSRMCLEQAGWDIERAAALFQGSELPAEAFKG
ncbi:hypothetical protein BCR34DRAFT_551986 [Clohesyomyces aquaticus]|uniref:mRNA export factor MEX67 n=1 Tax=Clohesyomyces aquaticus TaxID=1231657 RepID=A0A1Y2AA73_9PLEO|nr:hypothetical protein BCR34DRAFT_551986 [Clohesyomyces aquaticus]